MISNGINAPVKLFERLERETWEAKLGRTDISLLSNCQIQSTNRQHVSGWAEGQADVDTALYLRAIFSVELPAARGIGEEINLEGIISYPT